jgi:hypothetical protein
MPLSDDEPESPGVHHDAWIRRFSMITDIRHTEGGYKLSHEVLMIFTLYVGEDWELLPCDRRFFLRVLTPGFKVSGECAS